MSVLSHLSKLASDLNIAENEASSISTSNTTLESRLKSYFGSQVTATYRFGSSVRSTMLPRKADAASDVDRMIIFDNSSNYKPATFIAKLKRFAVERYSTSEIYQSAPTVVLELKHIKFDLVPGYVSWGSTYIPAPASSWMEWMETSPFSLNEPMNEANKRLEYRLKPAVRLVKYWNALNAYVYESYLLEASLTAAAPWSSANLRVLVGGFFSTLHSGRWALPEYKRKKVERAKNILDESERLEASGFPASAESKLKELLPEI